MDRACVHFSARLAISFWHRVLAIDKTCRSRRAFAANYAFWHESGYFDDVAVTKPLLHLWSLGIEEQFYIFWPMPVWLAWKKRLNFLWLAAAIGCISLAIKFVEYP